MAHPDVKRVLGWKEFAENMPGPGREFQDQEEKREVQIGNDLVKIAVEMRSALGATAHPFMIRILDAAHELVQMHRSQIYQKQSKENLKKFISGEA
jgi:hypothetical protein